MRYYELTINTKEAESLLERVVSYLPGPIVKEQKNPTFLSLEFYAQPEEIPELEKKLKQDLLRYLILVKTPTTFGKEVEEKSTRKKVVEKKVELEEIEKKLEEILGE
jgi:ribosomal protein S6